VAVEDTAGHEHNNDKGGALICCERCPASFLFICADPPILETSMDDAAVWLCRLCREREFRQKAGAVAQRPREFLVAVAASRAGHIAGLWSAEARAREVPGHRAAAEYAALLATPAPTAPAAAATDADAPDGGALGAGALAAVEPVSRGATGAAAVRHIISASLRTLVTAHATQFRLPEELLRSVTARAQLPPPPEWVQQQRRRPQQCFACGSGTLAGSAATSARGARGSATCAECHTSFHLDCLDPPLTIAPRSNWLCPLHAQHVLVRCGYGCAGCACAAR